MTSQLEIQKEAIIYHVIFELLSIKNKDQTNPTLLNENNQQVMKRIIQIRITETEWFTSRQILIRLSINMRTVTIILILSKI